MQNQSNHLSQMKIEKQQRDILLQNLERYKKDKSVPPGVLPEYLIEAAKEYTLYGASDIVGLTKSRKEFQWAKRKKPKSNG